MLGFVFACFIPVIAVNNNYIGIILAFVGILATFVVVSNYAQVRDIENKTKEQINELKIEIDDKIEDLLQLNLSIISYYRAVEYWRMKENYDFYFISIFESLRYLTLIKSAQQKENRIIILIDEMQRVIYNMKQGQIKLNTISEHQLNWLSILNNINIMCLDSKIMDIIGFINNAECLDKAP
ncbi:MAG: hypothetical protein LBT56_01235 [Prevotellaceae bacterium]|nr:hypothetical protein [Prevotellaceae bacterium]